MAEFIPRDLSTPFDPLDPQQIAEFEGFAATVPTVSGMIDFANGVPVDGVNVTRADAARATRMFAPGFLTGLVA